MLVVVEVEVVLVVVGVVVCLVVGLVGINVGDCRLM